MTLGMNCVFRNFLGLCLYLPMLPVYLFSESSRKFGVKCGGEKMGFTWIYNLGF